MDPDPPTRQPRAAPRLNPAAEQARTARHQREAAALRENLLRRKRQVRQRAGGEPPEEEPCR